MLSWRYRLFWRLTIDRVASERRVEIEKRPASKDGSRYHHHGTASRGASRRGTLRTIRRCNISNLLKNKVWLPFVGDYRTFLMKSRLRRNDDSGIGLALCVWFISAQFQLLLLLAVAGHRPDRNTADDVRNGEARTQRLYTKMEEILAAALKTRIDRALFRR